METTLNIDLFFFAALSKCEELMEMIDNRLFDTMRKSTAEEEDKIPYIIIVSDEGDAEGQSKDEFTDIPTTGVVRVLLVAENAGRLAKMQSLAAKAIVDANENDDIYDEHPDWDFSHLYIKIRPSGKVGDPTKPCLFRELVCYCEI